jgi:hypothetical protein
MSFSLRAIVTTQMLGTMVQEIRSIVKIRLKLQDKQRPETEFAQTSPHNRQKKPLYSKLPEENAVQIRLNFEI